MPRCRRCFYPPRLEVVGIDLSPAKLDIARRRAETLARHFDLQLEDAEAPEFVDESFDTVVYSSSLCSIPDERRALNEVRRVLRPGG